MERVKNLVYDTAESFEQINIVTVQNLASFIPTISIIHRMRSGDYQKVSSISAAPLVPLVDAESCLLG